jgi:hypothetical protein
MKSAAVLLTTLLVAACATEANDPTPTTSRSAADAGDETTSTTDRRVFPGTTSTGAPESAVGGVPDEKLEFLREDAAQRTAVSVDSVEVIRAQQVVWSSTALDCPEPGMFYTQVLTSGYWVVLLAGGNEYDYRATIQGDFRPCVGGSAPYEVLADR